MNIAIFSRDISAMGGGERFTLELANNLTLGKVRMKLFLYSVQKKKRRLNCKNLILSKRTEVRYYNSPKVFGERTFLSLSGISSLLQIKNVDVVYSTNTGLINNVSLSFISRLFGKKYILNITDLRALNDERGRIRHWLFKSTINMTQAVHVSSPSISQIMRDIGYRNRIYTIPNFPFYINSKVPLKSEDNFKILFVGRLQKHVKGIDLLDKVIRQSLSINNELKFYIAGYPEDAEQIILNLRDNYPKNVEWIGFKPPAELEAYYKNSHLFITTSRHETFGLAMLEAQIFGLPVVGFDVIGPKEMIKNKFQGSLVTPFNTKLFSRVINNYYRKWSQDKNTYYKASLRIINYVNKAYKPKKIMKLMLNMFKYEANN